MTTKGQIRIFLNGKERHERTFRHEGLTNIRQIKEKYGPSIETRLSSGKHRYVMFLGSKKQKKEMLAALRYPILPYPKGESRRYDASHKPVTQMRMF